MAQALPHFHFLVAISPTELSCAGSEPHPVQLPPGTRLSNTIFRSLAAIWNALHRSLGKPSFAKIWSSGSVGIVWVMDMELCSFLEDGSTRHAPVTSRVQTQQNSFQRSCGTLTRCMDRKLHNVAERRCDGTSPLHFKGVNTSTGKYGLPPMTADAGVCRPFAIQRRWTGDAFAVSGCGSRQESVTAPEAPYDHQPSVPLRWRPFLFPFAH